MLGTSGGMARARTACTGGSTAGAAVDGGEREHAGDVVGEGAAVRVEGACRSAEHADLLHGAEQAGAAEAGVACTVGSRRRNAGGAGGGEDAQAGGMEVAEEEADGGQHEGSLAGSEPAASHASIRA